MWTALTIIGGLIVAAGLVVVGIYIGFVIMMKAVIKYLKG